MWGIGKKEKERKKNCETQMSVQIKTFVVIDGSLLEFRLLFLLLNCEFTFLFTLPGKTSYMSYAKTWCQD